MTIKKRVNADFLSAMKNKDNDAKTALSSVKAAITLAEKSNPNVEMTDADFLKIINKAIKQREESIEIFEKNGRHDLAAKESAEASVLRNYMPAQMSDKEVEEVLSEIMKSFKNVITNKQALIGKTIGEFNKKYQGRADIGTVKKISSQIAEN